MTTPTLSAISVNGGPSGNVQAISGTDFAIDANGGATLTVFGTCTALTFDGNGGSHVDGDKPCSHERHGEHQRRRVGTLNVNGTVTGNANGGAQPDSPGSSDQRERQHRRRRERPQQ
jgi:hypothetical protein